jgi:oligoribonuclease
MSGPENAEAIAFIDLETTGSTLSGNRIVEVGVAITDRSFNVGATKSWVVDLPDLELLGEMDPVVIDMHVKSGLMRDLVRGSGITIRQVDDELSTLLLGLGGGRHVPLAGSGVSHFDRQFIRRDMPHTDKLLSYWAYDVGVVRRFLRLAGYPIPDNVELTHRALDDALDHAAEARRYLDLLSQLAPRTVAA